MKKKFYTAKVLHISVLFMVLASLTSCEKYLDQQPLSDLSTDLFWRNADDAKLGIAGMYDGLQKTLSSNYIEWTEPRSDNFRIALSGEIQMNLTLNTIDANAPQASWKTLYETISRANFAIKYIPTIEAIDELVKNNYMAEAYAMRAYCYFYIVRLWGDAPLWLEPYEDLNQDPNLPRTSKDEIMESVIIPDLIKAKELVNQANTTVWDINIGSILAMLTDVYAWKKDYPKVLETSQELIGLNRYSLVEAENWDKLFTDPASTKENIWSLHWDYTQDGASGLAACYGPSNLTSRYFIDKDVLALFESNKNDIRRKFTYDTTMVSISKIGKFFEKGSDGKPIYPSTSESAGYYPLYRYADVLLLRAEALNAVSFDQNKVEVLALINQVRERAQVYPLEEDQVLSAHDMESAILSERQIELFGESKRWFDLIRTGRLIEVMDPVIRNRQRIKFLPETGFGDPNRILLPVSRTALNGNPNLTQNPPYSE